MLHLLLSLITPKPNHFGTFAEAVRMADGDSEKILQALNQLESSVTPDEWQNFVTTAGNDTIILFPVSEGEVGISPLLEAAEQLLAA